MKISKKVFYIYFIAILVMIGVLWGNLLGSEPISSMVVLCTIALTIIVVETTSMAYFKYYSDKIIFAKGPRTKPSRGGFLSKPQNQPIARYSETYQSHGLFWCFSGFNRGMSFKGSSLFVAPLHMVDYKNLGRTIYLKGEQAKILKHQLFECILDLVMERTKDKKSAIATAKQLYNQMVSPDIREIYIPLPLSKEEMESTRALVGSHPFGADRFEFIRSWMVERQVQIEASVKILNESIINKLSVSQDFMKHIKYNKMEIKDAEQEGREIRPQSQEF